MKLDTSLSRLTLTRQEWTAIGNRAGWLRQARRLLVQWEDGNGAESVGISGAVDDSDVANYLERTHGRKVKGWKPAGRKASAPLNPAGM